MQPALNAGGIHFFSQLFPKKCWENYSAFCLESELLRIRATITSFSKISVCYKLKILQTDYWP